MTDANVVLGTLHPTHLLGGRMPIRRDLALAAIEPLARRLGMGAMETAQGILSVVTANMAKAIRVISVQRGHDPRDYTLVAFGGAGPLHAARLARELEMRRVLVPRNPGILCAMGLLLTDLRADFAATRLTPLGDEALGPMRSAFAALEAQAARWFDAGRHPARGAAAQPHRGHALCRPELRACGAAAGGRSGPGARSRRWRRASRPRTSACTASSRRRSRCSSSPSASRRSGEVRKAEFRPRPLAGSDPAAALAGSARGLAAGSGRRCPGAACSTATGCCRATASKARPSSSRWTPPPSSCPGRPARVDAHDNLILESAA